MKEGETFTYTLVLESEPTGPVTIALAPGTLDDFITLEPASLTFTSSDWNVLQEVVITALEDGSKSLLTTAATITHEVAGGDYDSETVSDIAVTITDTTQFYIHLEGAQAFEADGHVEFVVSVLPGAPGTDIQIRYTTVDGTAVAGTHYTREVDTNETFKTFDIPADQSMATIRIPIPDDEVYEAGDRIFTLQLSDNSSGNFAGDATALAATGSIVDDDGESVRLSFWASLPAGVTAGTPAQATVAITDDDVPQVTVQFGAASYIVAEGSSRSVTVTLSVDPERTVTIPIEATGRNGATSADYSVPASLTFTAGQTSMPITFAATADNENDDGESVRLSFGATLPAGVTAGTPAQATVTITDDDAPTSLTVSFGQSAYTVAESDDTGTANVMENTVEVTVTLSVDPERTVTIPIETTDLNGATAADYSGVPQNVTFNAGDTSMPFTFAATQDTVDDDGESVRLSFGASLPPGVTAGTPAQATVTITDDAPTSLTVSFGQSAYTVAESDDTGTANVMENTVEVTVTLSVDPRAYGNHPHRDHRPERATAADYSGRAPERHLRQRRHLHALHLRRHPGHGGRRRRERQAVLRSHAGRAGERGQPR